MTRPVGGSGREGKTRHEYRLAGALWRGHLWEGVEADMDQFGQLGCEHVESGACPHSLKTEVARLAGLARIALTPSEVERLADELGVIADSVAKVSEVATPEVPATSHPIPLTNVMREDKVVPP